MMNISEKMQKALNTQIKEELNSFYIYLSMATHFDAESLDGFSSWMQKQANEEMAHAMRIYNYINERNGRVILEALDKPESKWDSPLDVFETAYKHEQYITDCIHKLVKLADQEDDQATRNFLQWFVQEQVEEEASTGDIVDKLKMIGDHKYGLFMYNRVLGERK